MTEEKESINKHHARILQRLMQTQKKTPEHRLTMSCTRCRTLDPIPKSTQFSMLPNNFPRCAETSARCALQNHSEIKSSPGPPSAAGEKHREKKGKVVLVCVV